MVSLSLSMLLGLLGSKTIKVTTDLGYYEVFEKVRNAMPCNVTRFYWGYRYPNYSYYSHIYNDRFEIVYGDYVNYRAVYWVHGKVQKKVEGSVVSLNLMATPLELIKITILTTVFILLFGISFQSAVTLVAHLGYGVIVFIYTYWYIKNRQQLMQFTIELINGKIISDER